jgi:hypothetical protein
MVGTRHDKAKRLEKIIPQQQHHPHLDATIRKLNYLCRHTEEAADGCTTIIFIRVIIHTSNPLYLLTVDGK